MNVELHRELSSELVAEIRDYLVNCTQPIGDHDPRWLHVLRDAMGHQPFVLLAKRGGDVVGYLPLAGVSSRLFGRYLVSLPYLNYAGVVADDEAVTAALLEEANRLAVRLDVSYLECRHGQGVELPEVLGHERTDKVRMVMDLPDSADELWSDLKAKVRNQIRKAEKFDLQIAFGRHELLDGFYDVFSENMRDLGTPVYPKRLFEAVLDQFRDEAELVLVTQKGERDNEAVSGALLMHQAGGQVTPATGQVPSASCLRRHNKTNANMWMYHRMLVRAIERGNVRFDFGRSTPPTGDGQASSGTYRFKKQWGAEPEVSRWQYVLRKGELNAVRPDHPKYRRKIETWQKLPVWVTRVVGPMVVRGIP